MVAISYAKVFEKLVDQALDSEEVQQVIARTNLFRRFLREQLLAKSEALLASVASEIKEYEEQRGELERVKRQIGEAPAPGSTIFHLARRGIISVTVVLLLVAIALFIGKVNRIPILSDWSEFVSTGGLFVGVFLILLTLPSILTLIARQVKKRHEAHHRELRRDNKIEEREHSLREDFARLEQRLLQGPILQSLRGIIASQLEPSYSTELRPLMHLGLSDVSNPDYEVETRARRELGRLLREMGGGTIGISGPRGAGKTTLIQSFCKPDLPTTPIEQRTIRIEASAPIQYDARDFILHLFSAVCYAVLDLVGLKRSAVRKAHEEAEIPTPARMVFSRRRLLLSYLSIALVFVSATFLFLGMAGFLTTVPPPEESKQEPSVSQTGTDLARQVQLREKTVPNNGRGAEPSEATGGDSSSRDARRPPVKTLRSELLGLLQLNKGGLFRWGSYSLVLAILLYVARPWLLRLFEPRPTTGPRTFKSLVDWAREQGYEILQSERWLSAAATAYHHILNIHFQQSFSTGWKGSLSASVLSAERSETQSFSTKQQTLPDIVSEFRDYLRSLAVASAVTIAIDEMDKMEAPERAQQFLNDIKAIFGVPDCIYLVSISESAMSSFERRGLPIRDAFDSSFHEVVRVKYLDIEESIEIVNQRVIGLPIPFDGLCHCLSGGLARDLIRCCRKVVTLSSDTTDLRTVTHKMVRDEISAKVDALHIAVKNLSIEPELARFVSNLVDINANDFSAARLLFVARELWQLASDALAVSGGPAEEAAQRAAIAGFASELGGYLYYLATVEELFAGSLNEGMFKRGGLVEKLALARQNLAVNPQVAVTMISNFRHEHPNMTPFAEIGWRKTEQ